jgi:Ser/Thr protein kinase RdoA (MazF antagonist)
MNMPTQPAAPPAAVLSEFGLEQPRFEQLTSGHINVTWRLQQDSGADIPNDLILQRVNRIFHPTVQNDILAVTAHLRACGTPTIELISTRSGDAYLEHDGDVWRLMTYIEGTTSERVENSGQAKEAGRVLGRFHTAMRSFRGTLSHARTNVHDFSLHLQRLDMALLEHRDHRDHTEIASLGARIVETAADIHDFPPTRNVFVHGDPKISNIIFDNDKAVCLIDLDTLTTMPIEVEIADALRSWCNVEAEDSPNSQFSAEVFAAACEGYAGIDRDIAEMLPDTTAKIAVELAARFCTDALEEVYFGWDSDRFESASAHNRRRCHAQLALAADILRQRTELRRIALNAVTLA